MSGRESARLGCKEEELGGLAGTQRSPTATICEISLAVSATSHDPDSAVAAKLSSLARRGRVVCKKQGEPSKRNSVALNLSMRMTKASSSEVAIVFVKNRWRCRVLR